MEKGSMLPACLILAGLWFAMVATLWYKARQQRINRPVSQVQGRDTIKEWNEQFPYDPM